MTVAPFTIAVVAPSCRIEPALADRAQALAAAIPDLSRPVKLAIHPQCFLSHGHFAGDDAARAAALTDVANDPGVDAVWFARGGYGAVRIVDRVLPHLTEIARSKRYLGYSDGGYLLAALDQAGFPHVAHGPVLADLRRDGGEAAFVRALRWLADAAADTVEPQVGPAGALAFNLTILSHLIGTPLEPDFAGRTLLVEDVSEHVYRTDRAFAHLASAPGFRACAGLRLGRFSDVPENDPAFLETEEEIARHWCGVAGVPYLGRADIGHDAGNKIVPFRAWGS